MAVYLYAVNEVNGEKIQRVEIGRGEEKPDCDCYTPPASSAVALASFALVVVCGG